MDEKIFKELGLSTKEYLKIVDILGREPNFVELSMYAVMWSEHCSYKSSKLLLKQLPTKASHVMQGPGENAGVVDIGDGLAIAMKIESHNHPSAVEPYQGAATGVGGILRDIFAMGARPIALLDSLRFGSLKIPRVEYLLDGVVAGIAGYGNCMGIPTVAGEIYFDDSYEGNPLVNAMCVGLVEKDKIIKGIATGEGNKVLLMGSKTGRDGIHGCTFASDELNEKSDERRPAVQVGDPFTEKLLMETCLELLDKQLLVGLQDFGAAGLTCATCETSSRGEVGMIVDIEKVPRREGGMSPFEVMISESQERMLAIVEPSKVDNAIEVCRKWGVDVSVIGEVTRGDKLKILNGPEVVAEMPARSLAEEGPVYRREVVKPEYIDRVQKLDLESIDLRTDFTAVLLELLSSPNIASKHWVYEQYDHMVQTNSVVLPGSDAAVLKIKGTSKGIALTTDCNGRYCYLDPKEGSAIAVAEGARNIVCSGAKPMAITDCLNFGTPEKPDIFWQFEQSIEGISEACEALGVPIVSGNVSFYNESFGEPIYPTPTIGTLGLLNDVSKRCTQDFKAQGDLIVLIGPPEAHLDGSEYLAVFHGVVAGRPAIDLAMEKVVQECCLKSIESGIVSSAHDCSEGGLAVALAESCIAGKIGAVIEIDERIDSLFGESQSRIVLSLNEWNLPLLEEIAGGPGVPVTVLGTVGGRSLQIGESINIEVSALAESWRGAIEYALS